MMTSHFDKTEFMGELNTHIILLESALFDIEDKTSVRYKRTESLMKFIKSFRLKYDELFEENIRLINSLIENEKEEAIIGELSEKVKLTELMTPDSRPKNKALVETMKAYKEDRPIEQV